MNADILKRCRATYGRCACAMLFGLAGSTKLGLLWFGMVLYGWLRCCSPFILDWLYGAAGGLAFRTDWTWTRPGKHLSPGCCVRGFLFCRLLQAFRTRRCRAADGVIAFPSATAPLCHLLLHSPVTCPFLSVAADGRRVICRRQRF